MGLRSRVLSHDPAGTARPLLLSHLECSSDRAHGLHVLIQVSKLRRFALLPALTACALACAACLAAAAPAATITVTSSDPADASTPNACAGGPDDCTLAAAIDKANADADSDVIEFAGGITTLVLNAALPDVTEPLTINGAGSVDIDGSAGFGTTCSGGSSYAIDTTGAPTQILGLAIHGVCGRAIRSSAPAPSIRIGPRRADNSVSISGNSADGSVEIFRSDASGEGLASFQASVPVIAGAYALKLDPEPGPSDSFTAIATGSNGISSGFSGLASVPGDLQSPTLVNAVATSNNSVRLDFNEQLGGGSMTPASFALSMGGINRQITSVDISGHSLYLGSATTPWSTGEAGAVTFTGNGRVADVSGNELLGQPLATVFAGPGELAPPVISRFYLKWNKFCKSITRRCKRRKQTYLYTRLDKPARVVFNVYRATTPRRFVLSFVHKLPAGTNKSRLYATMNGRTMPSRRWLLVEATAEDVARNYSVPVSARFKIVTRNSQF